MKILYIAKHAPWETYTGARQRTNLLHRALSEIGEVDIFLWDSRAYPEHEISRDSQSRFNLIGTTRARYRGEFGPWRALRPLNPKLVDRLAHNLGRRRVDFEQDHRVASALKSKIDSGKYDVVVGRYFSSLAKTGMIDHPGAIIDIDDVPSSIYESRLAAPHTTPFERVIINRHIRQLRKIEGGLAKRAAGLWVTKNADRTLNHELERAAVLPNICWHPPCEEPKRLPSCDNPVLISIGTLGYQPNVEGIRTFLRTVWPDVRRSVPEAIYRIYGAGLSDSLRKEFSVEGVEPIGFVDNVEDAYRSSAFAVAPVYFGGGTNIKVLEAFTFGRAIVVAAGAARGFEKGSATGNALLVANNAIEFAAHCVNLLSDPERRNKMAAQGAAAVRSEYSWPVFKHIVHQTVRDVVDTRRKLKRE